MNKLSVCVGGLLLCLCALDVRALPLVADIEQNPIDAVFDRDLAQEMATPEIAFVAEACLEAWKAELEVVLRKIRGLYSHAGDRNRLEAYLKAYEHLGQVAFDLEMLNWIDDLQASPEERSVGTGGPGAATLALARVVRQEVLNLIDHLNRADPENPYVFHYTNTGSILEKCRKAMQE